MCYVSRLFLVLCRAWQTPLPVRLWALQYIWLIEWLGIYLTHHKKVSRRIMRHPLYVDESLILRLMPDYQRYIETCGEISSKWGLRSRIEHFPTEGNADRPDLLEFSDKWMTDYNTFLDNKVPTGNRKALLSVFGTRFPNSATSSTKRIVRVSAPFFDE